MTRNSVLLLLFISVLTVSANAQIGHYRSSIGGGLLGDLLFANKYTKGTDIKMNAGLSGIIESQLNYMWSFRLGAKVYGLTAQEGYDRRAMANVCLKWNINNTIIGDKQKGNAYILLGAGATYRAAGLSGIGLALETGIGFSYWISKRFSIFSEINITLFGSPYYTNGTLAIGCVTTLFP